MASKEFVGEYGSQEDVEMHDNPDQEILQDPRNFLSSSHAADVIGVHHDSQPSSGPSLTRSIPTSFYPDTNFQTPASSFTDQRASHEHSIADTVRFSSTPDFPDESIPSRRQQTSSQSPSPPSNHDKGKGKAKADEIEGVPDSPTLRQRKPRPKPIFGGSDPNVHSIEHIQAVQTPTSATGFASLNLNGDPRLSHDLSGELHTLPKNMSDLMKEYLRSQLCRPTPTTPAAEGSNDVQAASASTRSASSSHLMASSSEINLHAPVPLSQPSKRIRTEAGPVSGPINLNRPLLPRMSSLPEPTSLPQGEPIPTPEKRRMKRTFAQTFNPLEDTSYKRTNNPNFNAFAHGILRHPDILFHFVSQLPVRDFISLYAISKVFHKAVNERFATMILSVAFHKAPESARAFPFRAFGHWSIPDPKSKKASPPTTKDGQVVVTIRRVPGFKWLQMILHREKVVQELLSIMAEDGVPLPPQTSMALKRIWLSMDIPDNARRIGYFHRTNLITDLDLFLGMMFIVKLDQRFTSPTSESCHGDGIRRLCFGQRSLTYILLVLKGLKLKTDFETLKEWVRYQYHIPRPDRANGTLKSVFGIPIQKVGRGCLINWGNPIMGLNTTTGQKQPFLPPKIYQNILLRPDELIQKECVRRKLRMKRYTLRMLLWGYIDTTKLHEREFEANNRFLTDPESSETAAGASIDPEPRMRPRRVLGLWDEYTDTDEIGAPEIPSDPALQDPYLDLGPMKVKSRFVTQPDRELLDEETKAIKEREEEFLDFLMALSSAKEEEEAERDTDKENENPWKIEYTTDSDVYLNPTTRWEMFPVYPGSPGSHEGDTEVLGSDVDMDEVLRESNEIDWADVELTPREWD